MTEDAGLRRLRVMAEWFGAASPFFFDPATGDVRERLQDVRGDDFAAMASDVLMLAETPCHLSHCRLLLHESERRRRETWAQCRELRETLAHLASTIRYEQSDPAEADINSDAVMQSVTAAAELLGRIGVETFDGEPE